ncbi:hypothetical protein A2456_01455 [Candidatus Nomurabacteria bacterium RIFOXYC2_FULL_36_19]|uniref:HTH deoR-type domain-containing protein n=1 Tax=Candidatus Nomurabacteria bacterium RIFOXYC2_FULL_36_19 TaxID=1801806 RepID=A0A1F6YW49_9BACT|nr:MAG: hypothetical protein A2456_01455 [Candidatus Nomurabacteria bacterium RIFOXYC2_FULL_36_19]OGJ14689.1 MAG: hypothetical protein A2554_01610 [Candidatus Nomurabacteria bacterium RIFOXYD2_FULL_35_12]
MPDDEKPSENPTPEQNSIPPSPQEPTADAPILPVDSEPTEVPSEAPEASREGFSDESNNITLPNSTSTESSNEGKTEEKPAENEPSPEPVSEPIETPESGTAQISTNEPLKSKPEELPPSASLPEEKPPASPELKSQTLTSTEAMPPVVSSFNHMRKLQVKEQLAIKNKKRKKLDLVMTLFLKKSKITNDEVEKFLHVSDATATRYLSILEKEGKIKQNGKTGHMVSYSRI